MIGAPLGTPLASAEDVSEAWMPPRPRRRNKTWNKSSTNVPVGWEENQAHRSAEFEHCSKEILMKARVEAPIDLLDNWVAIPPCGSDRVGKSRRASGVGGHRGEGSGRL